MDTKIYNIDSRARNATNYPNISDFVYNAVDATIGGVNTVEPFNEKNVVELKVSSIELPDSVATLDAAQTYFLMQINNYGNIINRNMNYVAKVVYNANNTNTTTLIAETIRFDQPIDINNLRITLVYQDGATVNMGTSEYAFSFEIISINNSIMKNYDEIRFYNDKVMERLLRAKMLAYYQKQVDKDVNDTLTSTYNMNLTNLNNVQEYTPFGSANNYSPSYSYFNNMTRK
jgi:hypothetical protein